MASSLAEAIEILPNRLFWAAVGEQPDDTAHTHYFCVDEDLVYQPFFRDFGPLNLSMVCRFCWELRSRLLDPEHEGKRIVHCCSLDPEKRANAVCLICTFQVLALGRSAEEAFEPFHGLDPQLKPFRDASRSPCAFELTVPDCLEGLELAVQKGWYQLSRFNVESYEYFSQVENGDMNWIVPGKFLAFAGPSAEPTDTDGFPALTPEDYAPLFLQAGIRLAVRLNKPCYDRGRFTDHGVRHVDLYFRDGSCPSGEIIAKFLHVTESEAGAVGVHCKAGLGRTCTLIGLYAMKHYFFPAKAFIAWSRMCRPGSVLGPQQQFLIAMEPAMFQAGLTALGPRRAPRAPQDERVLNESMDMLSLKESSEDSYEDVGQGEHLCSAKRISQSAEWSTASPASTPKHTRSSTPASTPPMSPAVDDTRVLMPGAATSEEAEAAGAARAESGPQSRAPLRHVHHPRHPCSVIAVDTAVGRA